MWFLERKKDHKVVYILCNKDYTFGRKNCTVLISEDSSVSRTHLVIRVDFPAENETVRPPLKIKDLGSTYGTFINPVSVTETGKIEANTWVSLSKDSIVHFGLNNEWSIKWMDVTVLCSAMAHEGRRKLTAQLVKLGARQIADWSDKVTHLVMEKVVFTHKVMQCLIAGKPIINIEYFGTWTGELESEPSAPLPMIKNYVPQIDSQLAHIDKMLFLPRSERCNMFQGMVFIFPTHEQYESMSQAVASAGGMAVKTYDNEEAILVEDTGSNPSKDYIRMFNLQKQKGRRVIPLKEIGLAVLHSSTERYCNQTFNLEQTLFKNIPAQPSFTLSRTKQAVVLAPETQAASPSTQDKITKGQKNKIIPESPIKEPSSKRICSEVMEESMDTADQDAETQLAGRKSSIFLQLERSSTVPDTPDGAALGKPSKSISKSSLLSSESKPGPRSKKMAYISDSEAADREVNEFMSTTVSTSPSPESMQKVKPCPRSKKLLNSQSPVEVQTSHQNKPSPLCRKPLHSQSPEGLQNSSKSPVPLERPGPLSKKRGLIRDTEETQVIPDNPKCASVAKPGPLSKTKKLSLCRNADEGISASPVNVPVEKPSPLLKKRAVSQVCSPIASTNSDTVPATKPGPLSKKMANAQNAEGVKSISSENVPVAKPEPLSEKTSVPQCGEETRTGSSESVTSSKPGPLSKKLAPRIAEEGQFSSKNSPYKPGPRSKKMCNSPVSGASEKLSTPTNGSTDAESKKTEENDVSEASAEKKAELARKKAQKTSRPSEIPPESRSGPLSKKVAIQHSPLGTLVSGTSKSVNQAQVTSIERSGTSDLQNSLVPSKASKRPASPNAADGTPNSKKILVRSKSPEELFKQVDEKSKDGSLPSMSKTLTTQHNTTSGSINAKTNSRLSKLKSELWEHAREHSALNDSMSKLAVRCKLLRTDRSISMNETNRTFFSNSTAEMKLPTQRIRNFRVAYYQDGKWLISSNATKCN